MRSSSSTWRTLIKAASLALLWLLCASMAGAAPAHHRRTKSRVCDPHSRHILRSLTGRRAVGPVSEPSTRARAGLTDPVRRLHRAQRPLFEDEVAAITNDAPVAEIDSDPSVVPAFDSVGVLSRPACRLPVSNVFSPRSPRGPPYSA